MSRMHHRREGYPFGSLVDFAPDSMGRKLIILHLLDLTFLFTYEYFMQYGFSYWLYILGLNDINRRLSWELWSAGPRCQIFSILDSRFS